MHQLLQLLWLLLVWLPRPDAILMQNPPAIPTMAVCWLAALRHKARWAIDWHNFGYTIMGLSMGPNHWLVRVARALEVSLGRKGHIHFCVTQAMQQELQDKWGIPAAVLYDRPPSFFKRTNVSEAHQLFSKLTPALEDPNFQDFLSTWHCVHQQECAQGETTIATTLAAPARTATTVQEGPSAGYSNTHASGESNVANDSQGTQQVDSVLPSSGCVGPIHVGVEAAGGGQEGLGGEHATSAAVQQGRKQLPQKRHPGSHEGVQEVAATAAAGAAATSHAISVQPSPSVCALSAQQQSSTARWRAGRPAIVVSSTSWTPDEDFGMLLEAACMYDQRASQPEHASSLPDVLFLITGKGPQKDMYLSRLRALPLRRVAFRSVWLEAPDYPKLLGSADLGVSLHSSSSGLDLPMKVVDMFGCSLPVCALAYSCISELVAEGETGLLFSSAQGLADNLVTLLHGFGSQVRGCCSCKLEGR
ncbi:glycosyl transferases group 1-domain-containing protein [Dunaliella salina]|uniref:Glycosyl transferases group 1-domain-containing protein n=1 Tax=Dunaliella salina TaxID=3046 RepID=A0ABQ7FWJ7_DUNSA|nr:glycosyl transferases group 1-domain-containing protein [Dunaliella salina]|eukprot:KAF5826742.1 glycosyl transferases group 1-domain-containing protein [Dunaliella salina]